jgi:hypothetical protein
MSSKWKMPKPNVGDVVLFSKDYKTFDRPTAGFVVNEPGEETITILTFSPSGYATVNSSCHHRDDPALRGDNGWQDLGVWDFAPATAALRELQAEPTSGRKTSK